MIITNASPLIYLAKIGKLELLERLFGKVISPKEVYNEVVKGKARGFFDAVRVEKAVKDGWLEIREANIDKSVGGFAHGIDRGELAVISLAVKVKPEMVLIGDASARVIAESFGFNVKGTLYVLLEAYSKKLINKKETKELVNDLISAGFRISSELYGRVLDEIDKA